MLDGIRVNALNQSSPPQSSCPSLMGEKSTPTAVGPDDSRLTVSRLTTSPIPCQDDGDESADHSPDQHDDHARPEMFVALQQVFSRRMSEVSSHSSQVMPSQAMPLHGEEALTDDERLLMTNWYCRTERIIYALNKYVKFLMSMSWLMASCLVILPGVCSFTAKRNLGVYWWVPLLLSSANLVFIALVGIFQPSSKAESARTAMGELQNVLDRMNATVLRFKFHMHPERIMNGILAGYVAATKMTPTIPSRYTLKADKMIQQGELEEPPCDRPSEGAMVMVPDYMLKRIATTKDVVSKNRKKFTHQATAAKIKGSLLAASHTGCGIVQNVALLVGVTAAESQAREDLIQKVAFLGSVAGVAASGLAGCISQMQFYQQENYFRGEAQQFSEWTRKLELLELNRLCTNSIRVTQTEALTFLDEIKKRIDTFKKNGVQHVEFPHDLSAPLIGRSSKGLSARISGGGSNP